MNRLALAAVFAVVFAVALAAFMPLGTALALTQAGAAGLRAGAVSGSIWNGRLDDMRLGGIRFGTVAARLDPVSLLSGARRLHLESREASATLVEGRLRGFDGADAVIDIALLGLPVEGVVRLQGASVLFENGKCSSAKGRVIADIAHGAWKGPALQGEWVCDGAAAVARLSGRDAGAEANLTLSVDANARYRLQTRVSGSDAALRLALGLAGFVEGEGGMLRSDSGRLGT